MKYLLLHIGQFFIMIKKVFSLPEKKSIFLKQFSLELEKTGLNSIGIVTIISFFIGAVVAIQTAYNFDSPLYPKYLIGYATRESLILEFCPTMLALILAGKVGSNIASEIGSMRVTEQIDALEVMGINTYNYLIFPKIIALLLYPLVICISMFLGIFGGYIACVYGGFSSSGEFIQGIQLDFTPFHVTYAFIKTAFFSFILATIPSFHGYFMTGGALEVGKASTVSFVWTSVVIILLNYLITQLLLT